MPWINQDVKFIGKLIYFYIKNTAVKRKNAKINGDETASRTFNNFVYLISIRKQNSKKYKIRIKKKKEIN